MLSAYQRLSYRIFGRYAARIAPNNPHLRQALMKAHIGMRPDVYLSTSYLNMTVALVLGGGLVLVAAIATQLGLIHLAPRTFLLITPFPLVLAATIYLISYMLPDTRVSGRARDIDAKLPFALNYVATMAAAGIPLEKILHSLSEKPIYGEIANEAAWIHRDVQYLGLDILSALNAALERAPSQKFQDLLQGIVVTLTSGGNLKAYFRSKSEQFSYENRQDQKKFLETLGVLSESFVTVVVAAPLFLLVLLSVMTMFGGSADQMLTIGYVLILALLPLAQAGFILTINSMTREA